MKDFVIGVLLSLVLGALGIGFFVGQYKAQEKAEGTFSAKASESQQQTQELLSSLAQKSQTINFLQAELSTITDRLHDLATENQKLGATVLGIQSEKEQLFPFQVPSNGTSGTFNGTFGGNMYGFRHLGIDIWTTTDNSGSTGTHRGNPVYAACSGVVDNRDPANGGLTIKCDPISHDYLLPSYEVYTYYGHMGNAISKELYHVVHPGKRIQMGELIGYQGDLSSYFPEMRNVHLHFSVFSGLSENDKRGGAYNPCLYIGGDCTKAGEVFKTLNAQ